MGKMKEYSEDKCQYCAYPETCECTAAYLEIKQNKPHAVDKKYVAKLWQSQFGPFAEYGELSHLPRRGHPYTCGNREDHPVVGGDRGILVPTMRGWICPFCDYTQGYRAT